MPCGPQVTRGVPVQLRENTLDQAAHAFGGSGSGVVEFLGGGGVGGEAGGHVGDHGKAEDVHAVLGGDDDLRDRGHADRVGAQGAEGPDFGGRFEVGAGDGEVDAVMK
tara:strand:- start:974 stop:1297 length:324 start_codon:yes stop_codon:yes gene_type:complete